MISPQEKEDNALSATDENLVCTMETIENCPENAEEDESMAKLYEWRLNMARARVIKIDGLKKQLESLELDYLRTRALIDRQLLEKQGGRLEEILKEEQLPFAVHRENASVAWAKKDLRNAAIVYLIGHKEEIQNVFRREIAIKGCETATYRQLLEMVFSELLKELPAQLPEPVLQVFLDNYRDTPVCGLDLYHFCREYPGLEHPEINIYRKEDIETFYGHILATLSGIGLSTWENYRSRKKSMNSQLLNYDSDAKPLPPSHELGILQGPMRVFLIRKICHAATEDAVTERPGERAGMPTLLLEHFEYFGQAGDSLDTIDTFKNLPEEGPIMDGLQRIIGKTTRRKIMSVLSGVVGDKEDLLTEIYGLLVNIVGLDNLPDNKNREELSQAVSQAMAYQFGQELLQQLRLFHSQKKPVEGQPDHCVTQIAELNQLALYCLKRIRSA